MTSVDPHGTLPEPVDGPFSNGYQVDMDALAVGEVELPYVSSRLIIQGNGNDPWLVRFQFKGGQFGQVASNDPFQRDEYPVRAVKLIPLTDDDLADGWRLPGLVLSLW